MIVQALTIDEVGRLLGQARRASERDWLMILVAYLHGLRATEVVTLREDAVADGAITVKRLKGSLKTTHPLLSSPDPLFDERRPLIELARKSKRGERLFPLTRSAFRHRMRKYCLAAGIPARKAHPHALKHSIALQAIHEAGIEHVRQYLGHKSMSSTGQYLRVNDQEAAAKVAEALGLARPRQRRLID